MITTRTIREIRALLRSGMSRRAIARELGLNENTVGKYQNDTMADRLRQRGAERRQRVKSDPDVMARRRAQVQAWRRRARALRQQTETNPE